MIARGPIAQRPIAGGRATRWSAGATLLAPHGMRTAAPGDCRSTAAQAPSQAVTPVLGAGARPPGEVRLLQPSG
jgi:hypothetical protein